MSDATLQALLSTKAALDLGLVSQEDYDTVKSAFLRAQQLRAAVDAGLMREEDYEATKGEFLASLTLSRGGNVHREQEIGSVDRGMSATKDVTAVASTMAKVPLPAPSPAAPPAPKAFPISVSREENDNNSSEILKKPPISACPPVPPPVPAAGLAPVTRTGVLASDTAVPTNIPKLGGAKSVSSGTSMSGIRLSQDAVNIFYHVRSKSAYKWVLWKIDETGTTVVIDAVGNPGSSYESFLNALPKADCRYGVFDYQLKLPDGGVLNKLVFLNWAPDNAKVKSKMMYASTKDFFKGHLDGMSAEFQASDLDEISEKEISEVVAALKR